MHRSCEERGDEAGVTLPRQAHQDIRSRPVVNEKPVPLRQLAAIRAAFPGTNKYVYFETSARGLMPLAARDAALRYLDGRIHEGGEKSSMIDAIERVRAKFARLIGADA